MFWGGQSWAALIGRAGNYLPAHNISDQKKSMLDRTLATPDISCEKNYFCAISGVVSIK